MAEFKIAYNAATKVATVQDAADALPAGSTKIADFTHDGAGDHEGDAFSHVFYHHVRDALYHLGELDMQSVTINSTTDFQLVWDVNVADMEETVGVGETVALRAAINPPNASNKGLTYTSSKTDVATVNSAGVVTGVKEGGTVITIASAMVPSKKTEVIVTVRP